MSFGILKYIKQILPELKREIANNAIIVGNFNTSLLATDKPFREGNIGLKLHISPYEPKRHFVNIPSNSSKIHILFKHMSSIDRMLGHKTLKRNKELKWTT